MRNLSLALIGLFLTHFCRAKEITITLGDENFAVVATAGATTTLTHAPRTISSAIMALKMSIAVDNATIKIGDAAFAQGQYVSFTNPVIFTVTEKDRTTTTYTVAITPYDAVTNPYGIYTVKHLVDVAIGLTASFLLKNDISLPQAAAIGAAVTGISDYAAAGWKPFRFFSGAFDGGNFSINNFYIKRDAKEVGLFGHLAKGGIIKNLGVNGAKGITAVVGKNKASQYAGLLVGDSEGTIDKCYATGGVSSSSSSSSSPSSSSDAAAYAGGLAGYNSGRISNSYANGAVSSTSTFDKSYAGGLVGYSSSPIVNSYAMGNISSAGKDYSAAGGLVGYSKGSISNSYATGSVSSSSSSSDIASFAGGLAGYSKSDISNSYATGSVSSSASSPSSSPDAYAGGLAGYSSSSISNSYATGSVSASSPSSSADVSAGGLVGLNDEGTYANCYRNKDAIIKMNTQAVPSDDASIKDITPKTKAEMQTDAFKASLNGTGSAWGRDDPKNDKLPYLVGIGAGERKL